MTTCANGRFVPDVPGDGRTGEQPGTLRGERGFLKKEKRSQTKGKGKSRVGLGKETKKELWCGVKELRGREDARAAAQMSEKVGMNQKKRRRQTLKWVRARSDRGKKSECAKGGFWKSRRREEKVTPWKLFFKDKGGARRTRASEKKKGEAKI